jgi:uncharacterized phage-associated protein
MYDARQIANWFIQRASREKKKLSIMQLLKLVYIAHGWHLEITKNPLFRNRIEAWQHGPVIPDVYRSFRPQGVEILHEDARYSAEPAERVAEFLEEIYSIYGGRSPFNLSAITHVSGGPWETAIKRHGRFAPISDDSILDHYVGLRANRTAARVS